MKSGHLVKVFSFILLFTYQGYGQDISLPDKDAEMKRHLSDYMERLDGKKFSGTVLIAREGKELLHKGYGYSDRAEEIPNNINTVYDIGSITKQFTAAAILKLEMQSKLSVNDAIELYLPEFKTLKPTRTIHHLLTHTAGFPEAIGNDYDPISEEAFIEKALLSIADKTFEKSYAYSNVGYSLLTIIIERVSGMKYEEYLSRHLFIPSGMENTGYIIPGWKSNAVAVGYQKGDPWGRPSDKKWSSDGPYLHLKGNGGILSTTGDLYRWHIALKGENVLSNDAKKKYYQKHVPESSDESSFYGYGWAIFPTNSRGDLIAHNGGNGIFFADFLRFLETDQTIIVLSNASNKTSENLAPKLAGLIK